MSKNKKNKNTGRNAVEVEKKEIENQPTLERGNYFIEISDENGIIKKIAVANSIVNITKLKDGGFTVDL